MAARKNTAGLSRDLELLDRIVDADGAPSSVSELAAQTGRDKSQISRALSTLADAGILDRDATSRGYVIGWRMHTIAAQSLEAHVAAASRPYLRQLTSTYGETAEVVVLRADETIIIASEASRHALAPYARVGAAGPAASSSTCRAILATEPPELAATWLTPKRIAEAPGLRCTTPAKFAAEVARAREAGYSIVVDEFEEGVVGCSAPIRGPSGVAVAALGITAPKFRFEDSLIDAARTVRRLANQISNDLGSAAGKRSSLINL
jgi:DNA-binding IclR family transcriptional regulator